ncbi:hypothetical protein BS78_05G280600 [Paspalum vaginatum]|nr:hypothetical protein BS78_05G280600 [Paspalum vaginatum]
MQFSFLTCGAAILTCPFHCRFATLLGVKNVNELSGHMDIPKPNHDVEIYLSKQYYASSDRSIEMINY